MTTKSSTRMKHEYEISEGGFRECRRCGDKGITDYCPNPSSTSKTEKQVNIFVDDLIKRPKGNFSNKDRWLKDWLQALIASEKKKVLEEVKKMVIGVYTDETENGFWADVDLNRAHNGAVDIITTRLNSLKEE